jgi:GNAT superfamily N-acetyltransferase
MAVTGNLEFRIARADCEFEQIHGLNYRTFVEEIPQHAANQEKRLVDRFHYENTYFICLDGERVVGMIAVRANRPFSLDQKLDDLDAFLPECESICEFRLLAIEKEYRHARVLRELIAHVAEYCLGVGYDLGIISGTTRQQRLYEHIGFEPFGPLVGTEGALYQPMYLTLDGFRLGTAAPT